MVQVFVEPRTELQLIASVSESWIAAVAADLTRVGRPIEGGWPGTLSEARRRLMRHLAGLPPLPPDRGRFERLVDAIYRESKRAWQKQAIARSSGDDDL